MPSKTAWDCSDIQSLYSSQVPNPKSQKPPSLPPLRLPSSPHFCPSLPLTPLDLEMSSLALLPLGGAPK